MAFPDSVDGWLLGSSSTWHKIGSGPSGLHRIAWEITGTTATTVKMNIYHQFGMGVTSHIMKGYGAYYTYTVGNKSKRIVFKDPNICWNSGPDGSPANQKAKVHYYNSAESSGSYYYKVHSYTDNDPYGASTTKTWKTTEIEFNKTTDGKVGFSLKWEDYGVAGYGAPSSLELTISGKTINTGYKSYSEPTSYYTTTSPQIGKVDSTTFNTAYKLSLGTGGVLDWVEIKAFPFSTTWSYGKYANISSSVKNTCIKTWGANKSTDSSLNHKLYSSEGFGDGHRYRIAVRFSDSNYEWLSGDDKVIYTYKIPSVSEVSMSSSLFSPQDDAKIRWTTNSRVWTSLENNFTTTLDYNGKSVNLTNAPENNSNNGTSSSAASEKTFDNSTITTLFTTSERSVSKLSKTVYVTRHSSSGGYDVNSSTTVNIQYQPTKAPNSTHVLNSSGSSVQGQTIVVQQTPKIDVDWSYPISSGTAGVVNGYYLKVYSDSACTQAVNDTEYTISVSSNGGSGSKQLDTKSDLKRGVMNYAKITPYYTKPDGTGTIRGTTSTTVQLVLPISRLNTPTISYPVNNSIWHNKNFRILFSLPSDDDFNIIGLSESNYKYQNIEVKITPEGSSATTYTFSGNSNIFSTNNLTYQKKIAINPSILTSFPNAASYKIEIRVQKNYFVTSGEYSWSSWSNAVTIKNTAVSTQAFVAGMEIKASHYKYVRDASIRLYNTYPIKALPSENVAQSIGDTINHSEYKGIYDTILAIQSGVNDYCTYDSGRENIKFNQTINDLTSNPPKQEFITASKEDSSIDGRNYKNILVDDMNLLY